MLIPLNTASSTPLYLQIVTHVVLMARNGQLKAGDRLPGTRALAEQLSVHRSTIVNAYDELRAQGVIVAAHGSGSYVAAGLQVPAPVARMLSIPAHHASSDDILAELWRAHSTPGVISLAMGVPPDDAGTVRTFEQARATALRREGAQAFGYLPPEGYAPLRREIASDLARHGIVCTADEVVITHGAQEALMLVARALATNGDSVLIEQPSYYSNLVNLERMGLRTLGFGLHSDGPDMAALERACERAHCHPHFVAVTPDFHNPTGLCWSGEARHRFLRWASEREFTVVEDAVYRDLAFAPNALPPLRALDADVLYVGSFSKSFLPGLRIGYVLARGALREQLLALKFMSTGAAESASQLALAELMRTGGYVEHLARMSSEYALRRDALLDAMQTYWPADVGFTRPDGGFYTWVTLPSRIKALDVHAHALRRGIALFPAAPFYTAGTTEIPNALRLCFVRYAPEVLLRVVRELAPVM